MNNTHLMKEGLGEEGNCKEGEPRIHFHELSIVATQYSK